MVEIKVNWRCNVVHDWVEPVPQEAAGALYDRLGSQDLIQGTPRPRFWRSGHHAPARRTRAPEGTPRSPRPLSQRSRARSTSTSTSRQEPSTCSGPRWSAALSCPASAHGKWWARRSSDHRGLHVQVLQGLPKTGPEAPKSRWGENVLRHLQLEQGSETRPSGSHSSQDRLLCHRVDGRQP